MQTEKAEANPTGRLFPASTPTGTEHILHQVTADPRPGVHLQEGPDGKGNRHRGSCLCTEMAQGKGSWGPSGSLSATHTHSLPEAEGPGLWSALTVPVEQTQGRQARSHPILSQLPWRPGGGPASGLCRARGDKARRGWGLGLRSPMLSALTLPPSTRKPPESASF